MVFKELGLFREDFPVCEDYEFWLRLTARYEVTFVDEVLLVKYGGHKDQLSTRYFAMDYWRVKALKNFVSSKDLNPQEQLHVKKVLFNKIQILLKGCIKHKNFKLQKELEEISDSLKAQGF